jgi:hypothetical protein
MRSQVAYIGCWAGLSRCRRCRDGQPRNCHDALTSAEWVCYSACNPWTARPSQPKAPVEPPEGVLRVMKWSLLVAMSVILASCLCVLSHAGPADLSTAISNGVAHQVTSAPPVPAPPFGKTYIPYQFHEMLYFNGREADLEHHAFVKGKYMFATLTDVARHIGGFITWGPRDSYVEVERKGKKVRIVPGTSTVFVDGNKQYLDRSTFRINKLLYVPVRSYCDIFGCVVHWEAPEARAYVKYED